MDGHKWKVDYANKDDFKFFGWKVTQESPTTPSPRRSLSPKQPPSDWCALYLDPLLTPC